MTREELFQETCRRFSLACDAYDRGDKKEYRLQTMAHGMARAAFRGRVAEEVDAK